MHPTASIHVRVAELEEFLGPFYAQKDMMHSLSHIRRFLKTATSLSRKHSANNEILTYAAYVHGIDQRKHGRSLARFLQSQGLEDGNVARILLVARESQTESKPKTVEGTILHDAHLIEGGRTFLVVKLLVTGAQLGESLGEIIDRFEKKVDGKFKCYLPETERLYSEKERFARGFFQDLKRSL